MLNQFNWNTDSSNPDLNFFYEYISSIPIFYGIHEIKLQYENNPLIAVSAKFDTGAKSSSIDYEIAKKLGVPQKLIENAKSIIKEKMPNLPFDDEKIFLSNISEKYQMEVDKVKSASGITARAYIPITIYFSGKKIKTRANLVDRSGLKAQALIGLSDML